MYMFILYPIHRTTGVRSHGTYYFAVPHLPLPFVPPRVAVQDVVSESFRHVLRLTTVGTQGRKNPHPL